MMKILAFLFCLTDGAKLRATKDCQASYNECTSKLEQDNTAMLDICQRFLQFRPASLVQHQMKACRDMIQQCVKKLDQVTEVMEEGARATTKAKKCELKRTVPGIFPDLQCMFDDHLALKLIPEQYSSMCPPAPLTQECPQVCLCAKNLHKVEHHKSLIAGYFQMLEFEVKFCEQAASQSDGHTTAQCQISQNC
eukprot:GEMP01079802.1.p1 GENE.GEMP01079802.1~~GEMP01079802.1.p1  ORF type:complete len:194 (+),score=39.79 GEMP01079802.1:409-990(+)